MKNTILSLQQKLTALSQKFAKDPRTKNLGGFAIVGLLAVIVWASAQEAKSPSYMTLSDGTKVQILQEYAASYMVTKEGEHKPFFVEKKNLPTGSLEKTTSTPTLRTDLPYPIVDPDDKVIGNDILNKRPMLLIVSLDLWGSWFNDNSKAFLTMASVQKELFNELNLIKNSSQGKNLTIVSIMTNFDKKKRYSMGVTWPCILGNFMNADEPDESDKAIMSIKSFVDSKCPDQDFAGDKMILLKADGSVTPLLNVKNLNDKLTIDAPTNNGQRSSNKS